MKSVLSFSCLLLATILISSCDFMGGERIRGNGNVVSESHDIKDFNGVYVSGAMDLFVSEGQNFSVRIETDENLQSRIEVYQDGGILRVRPADNVNLDATDGVKVYVTAPSIVFLQASGACDIDAETILSSDDLTLDLSGASSAELDLAVGSFRAELSGASKATLHGETKTASVEGSGASHIKAKDLTAETATINLSGASSMEVHVTSLLEADLGGASDLTYAGSPKLKTHTSGASNIRAAD